MEKEPIIQPENQDKVATEQRVEVMLVEKGLRIADRNFEKPWGGYFVIDDKDTDLFISTFFAEHAGLFTSQEQKLSPKILVVGPSLRLSWQYHDRRAEWHKVVEGPVAYPLSETDEQAEAKIYEEGELIRIPQGTRHRLVGLADWGIVAEIWEHTDHENPSDEADNHRVQDDFKRA
ncbi:MAG: phosphoheptose isomerase [Candidatus Andersenbacteria bacterium]